MRCVIISMVLVWSYSLCSQQLCVYVCFPFSVGEAILASQKQTIASICLLSICKFANHLTKFQWARESSKRSSQCLLFKQIRFVQSLRFLSSYYDSPDYSPAYGLSHAAVFIWTSIAWQRPSTEPSC